MAKQIEIEFERGGKFTATLLEDAAPKACKVLWDHLPIEGRAAQARYGGEEFFFNTDLNIEAENQKKDFKAGDIAFNPHPKWKAIIIYYGNNIAITTPYNHIAKISEKLDELKAVGERIWLQGAEKVRICKL
ncbi:MAG: cyclophilin-like fold protein [Candidatus Bathyarchaeia archaeon]